MKKTSWIIALFLVLPLVFAIVDLDKDGIPDESDEFPGDFDNDGMSDNWEKLFGLRFDSATDASEDLDADGLTNLEEFKLGTDPKVANVVNSEEEVFAPTTSKISAEMILGTIIVVMIIVLVVLVIRIVQKKKKGVEIKEKKEKPSLKPDLEVPPLHIDSKHTSHLTSHLQQKPAVRPLPELHSKTVPRPVQKPFHPKPVKKPIDEPVYHEMDQELDDAFKKLEQMKKKFENETQN